MIVRAPELSIRDAIILASGVTYIDFIAAVIFSAFAITLPSIRLTVI